MADGSREGPIRKVKPWIPEYHKRRRCKEKRKAHKGAEGKSRGRREAQIIRADEKSV